MLPGQTNGSQRRVSPIGPGLGISGIRDTEFCGT